MHTWDEYPCRAAASALVLMRFAIRTTVLHYLFVSVRFLLHRHRDIISELRLSTVISTSLHAESRNYTDAMLNSLTERLSRFGKARYHAPQQLATKSTLLLTMRIEMKDFHN